MIAFKNIDNTNDVDSGICPMCGYYMFNITTHGDHIASRERYACSNCNYTLTLFLYTGTINSVTTTIKEELCAYCENGKEYYFQGLNTELEIRISPPENINVSNKYTMDIQILDVAEECILEIEACPFCGRELKGVKTI